METSRFSQGFAGAIVAPGTKVLASSRPECIAVSTKDKFVLNPSAMAVLGVTIGDRVAIIDMLKTGIEVTMNERFFLVPNYTNNTGAVIGAKIGKGNAFSYSGVWSAIISGDSTILAAKPEDLVRMERAVITERNLTDKDGNELLDKEGKPLKGSTAVALFKAHFEVSPVLNAEGANLHVVDKEGTMAPVFALTNVEYVDHEPRAVDEDDVDTDETEQEITKEDNGSTASPINGDGTFAGQAGNAEFIEE